MERERTKGQNLQSGKRHPPKPPGWGSAAYPTGNGTIRQQIMLAPGDRTFLGLLRVKLGTASISGTLRACLLEAAAAVPAAGKVRKKDLPQALLELVELCRTAHGRRPKSQRMEHWQRNKRMVHWVTRAERKHLSRLMTAYGFENRSEAARFAIRSISLEKLGRGK